MNLPNRITLTRICLIPVFIAAYISREYFAPSVYIAAGLFAAASLTDFADGKIARKYGLVTDTGKFFDSIADKALIGAALFVVLGYGLIPRAFGIAYTTVIVGRDYAINALRQIGAAKGAVIAADMFGKIKAALTMVSLTALLPAAELDALTGANGTGAGADFSAFGAFSWAAFCLLSLAVVLTILSGVNYIARNMEVLKTPPGKGGGAN